jgi:predicted ATPase
LALGARRGDQQSVSAALFGLYAVFQTRGQLEAAYQSALRMLRRAVRTHDASLLLQAHAVLGATTFHRGWLLRAKRHFETAISLYPVVVAKGGRPLALWGDLEVLCLAYAAFTWWLLGYPERAFASANQAVMSARALSDPHSLAFAEFFLGTVLQFRREADAAVEASDRVTALAQVHEFPYWLACASPLRAHAMAAQGRKEDAVAQIREGLAARLAAGAGLSRPYYLTKLAEACVEDDRPEEGLTALNEALMVGAQHQDRWFEAETLRLKGELLLGQGDSRIAEAQGCFQRAIEVARSQRAKSLELRAAMSLARLLATERKGDAERVAVAKIFRWFSEGFDTPDLKEARALLGRSEKQSSSSFQSGKRLTAA